MVEKYDVVVIGNGVGGHVALEAAKEGFRTALIDKPPAGGTCQNYGCKPSKTLIHIADRLMESKSLRDDGVEFHVDKIDFQGMMSRLRTTIKGWQDKQREVIISKENLDYYETEGKFIDEYTLETEEGVLKGEKIFIAAGARPFIPLIEGLVEIDFLTNESILELDELPERLVMIGGGYIGVEYAHFMSSLGCDVTVIQRGDKLVKNQDEDVSSYLKDRLSERMEIALDTEARSVSGRGGSYVVESKTKGGYTVEFECDEVMVAVGRRSNADRLDLDNTGVEVDERGYITVNDQLETSKENIWSLGDITGRAMFKHAANLEAEIVWQNSKGGEKKSLDYGSVPNAVFTDPKIASVGLTEREAVKEHDILVGRADYRDTVKGRITKSRGLAKAIVEDGSRELLGFHVIGPEAHLLLQEAVNVIALGGTVEDITTGIHTFPTLTRLIPAVLDDLKPVG